MRILVRSALVVSLLALGAAPADAQGVPASARLRLQRSLDAQSYRAVTQTIEEAQARGLPAGPLVNRALQATLLQAPGARVHDAVSKLSERLAIAQAALGGAASEAELSAGANALAAGVPPETLARIRTLAGSQPVTVPLGVLTELVARKVAVRHASEMVVALLRNGATPAQLVSLSDEVKHDIDAGIEPGAAFDIRTRGVLGSQERFLSDDGDRLMHPGVGGTTPINAKPTARVPRKP